MKWKTKSGDEIDVSDMSSSHAYNTIQMLIRNNTSNEVLNILLYGIEQIKINTKPKEITLNGDMAQQFNESMDNTYDPFDDMDPQDCI